MVDKEELINREGIVQWREMPDGSVEISLDVSDKEKLMMLSAAKLEFPDRTDLPIEYVPYGVSVESDEAMLAMFIGSALDQECNKIKKANREKYALRVAVLLSVATASLVGLLVYLS